MERDFDQEILDLLKKASPQAVTITFIKRSLPTSWPTARAHLLRLLAKGVISGEEISPHGWVFRAKISPSILVKEKENRKRVLNEVEPIARG